MTEAQAAEFREGFDLLVSLMRTHFDNSTAVAVGTLAHRLIRMLIEDQYARADDQTPHAAPPVH